MIEPKKLYSNNNTYKKTFSKVTTAKSSRKQSANDSELEGIIKSQHFHTLFMLPTHKYIKNIRKNMFLFPQYKQIHTLSSNLKQKTKIPIFIDNQVWKFTLSVMKKFDLNYETIGLGICYYIKAKLLQLISDQQPMYLRKFEMSVCIYLAAKTIELQRKIPKPPAYQYFCGQNYTFEDYNKFQRQLAQVLSYDLQKTTVFTFLHLYLSIGIFYQNEIFQTGKQIYQLENQILERGLQSLRTCNFLSVQNGNPEIEAFQVIKQIRKKYYMTQQNKNLLQFLSKQSSINQNNFSSSLKLSKSVGNLMNISKCASTYTHRITQQSSEIKNKQQQNGGHLKRKSLKRQMQNKGQPTKNIQIIKRKPNLDKSYKRKTLVQQTKINEAQQLKYVALKDTGIINAQTELNKELIRCKSESSIIGNLVAVSMKYQKNSININSVSRAANKQQQIRESQTEKQSKKQKNFSSQKIRNFSNNNLNNCQITQSIKKLQIQRISTNKKISRFAALKQDRIVQKSRSRSKQLKQSEYKNNNLNSSKYFHRKNYANDFNRIKIQNRIQYRNK